MNPPPKYQSGTFSALLSSPHLSAATRTALTERLAASERPYAPSFFTIPQFQLLRHICFRLTGADALAETIDVARQIDSRLARGETDGWRLTVLPQDPDAWRIAVDGIDAESRVRYAVSFIELSGDQQDALLTTVQNGEVTSEAWETVTPDQFFEDILAEVSEAFYAHPLAQEEIGYVGMADLPSWQALGLNQLDDREPRAIGDNDAAI